MYSGSACTILHKFIHIHTVLEITFEHQTFSGQFPEVSEQYSFVLPKCLDKESAVWRRVQL